MHQGNEGQEADKVPLAIGVVAVVGAIRFLIGSASSAGSAASGSVAYEWLKSMPTALVTLALGLLAAWIANGQKNIAAAQKEIAAAQRDVAAARLNLDLFDKRLEIYTALEDYLCEAPKIAEQGYEPGQSALTELTAEIHRFRVQARFLFGPEIAAKFKQALDNAHHMRAACQRLKAIEPGAEAHERAQAKVEGYQEWFTNAYVNLPILFRNYLDFSGWSSERESTGAAAPGRRPQ